MNILIFGPNGSGKGTQSKILKERYQLKHIESGGIFREEIGKKTKLGLLAKSYIDKGFLVPDTVTIPMIVDYLVDINEKGDNWILDGFPRNPNQAGALLHGLKKAKIDLGAAIVIELSRETSKKRLLGRRACPDGHPNNQAIPEIAPKSQDGTLVCWKCGLPVSARDDDIDVATINARLEIYFDPEKGTMGSIRLMENLALESKNFKCVKVDGNADIKTVANRIEKAMNQ